MLAYKVDRHLNGNLSASLCQLSLSLDDTIESSQGYSIPVPLNRTFTASIIVSKATAMRDVSGRIIFFTLHISLLHSSATSSSLTNKAVSSTAPRFMSLRLLLVCFALFSGGQRPLMMREDSTFCMRRFSAFFESLSQNTTMPFDCCVPAAQRDNTIPKRVGRMSHPAAAEVPPRLFEPFPMNNGKALLRVVVGARKNDRFILFCRSGRFGQIFVQYVHIMWQHSAHRHPSSSPWINKPK